MSVGLLVFSGVLCRCDVRRHVLIASHKDIPRRRKDIASIYSSISEAYESTTRVARWRNGRASDREVTGSIPGRGIAP